MAIFSHKLHDDSQYYGLDELLSDDSIDFSTRDIDYVEESYAAVLDAYTNWSNLYKSIYIREAANYNNDLYPLNENFIEDLIMGIKKFLVHLWRAIASMFKSFTMWLDKHTLSDKSFLNKYRKELASKTLDSDFSFSGYIFTIDEREIQNAITLIMQDPGINSSAQSNASIPDAAKANTYGQGQMDNPTQRYIRADDEVAKLRAQVLQRFTHAPNKEADRKLESKDFLDELNAALRNGKDSTEEIDNKLDINNIMSELESSKNTRRIMSTALREGKRAIDQAQKDTDQRFINLRRTPVENPTQTNQDQYRQNKAKRTNEQLRSDQMKELSYFAKYIQQSRNILVTLEGCVLRALKDRSKQNKAAIIAVIQYKSKNESVEESKVDLSVKPINPFFTNPFTDIDFK